MVVQQDVGVPVAVVLGAGAPGTATAVPARGGRHGGRGRERSSKPPPRGSRRRAQHVQVSLAPKQGEHLARERERVEGKRFRAFRAAVLRLPGLSALLPPL
uniref:Uncharacterized protein n=1 Tax=Arundo donax TaxID=35708 RepID=A0A0A9GCA7_ARUDO